MGAERCSVTVNNDNYGVATLETTFNGSTQTIVIPRNESRTFNVDRGTSIYFYHDTDHYCWCQYKITYDDDSEVWNSNQFDDGESFAVSTNIKELTFNIQND